VGLVSPRSQSLDDLSASPFLRKVVQRLPASIRSQAVPYRYFSAVDKDGAVFTSRQDPNGEYHTNTGVIETDNGLYLSSLQSDSLTRISRENTGI
jgi:hypothetical protein